MKAKVKNRATLKVRRQVDERLAEMAAARLPGETFSQSAIARFCGVSCQSIQRIERDAKKSFANKLRIKLGLSWGGFSFAAVMNEMRRETRRKEVRLGPRSQAQSAYAYQRMWYHPKVHLPRKGEIRFKDFILLEAERTGMTRTAILRRYYRGLYAGLKVRVVNKRVVFISLQP